MLWMSLLIDYDDLEATAVKAAYDVGKAKVDAVAKTDEFADIDTALAKEIDKIKKSAAVDAVIYIRQDEN